MAEQQNINQFGREELIDILQYLYVQGSQILYYKRKFQNLRENTVKKMG